MGELVLGVIPARGGSKGIPRKNIQPLLGKPLLEYTVRAAQESKIMDLLILSTDSAEIATVGRKLGVKVPFIRPMELSKDDTPMFPVIEHAVRFVEEHGMLPQIVLILQPTAPLRTPEHIVRAVDVLRSTGCDSVVSVTEVPAHYSPDFVMKVVDGRLVPFLSDGVSVTRRQDARPAYVRDGTIYAVRRDVLIEGKSIYGRDCRPMILPPEETVILDTLEDWDRAERLVLAKQWAD